MNKHGRSLTDGDDANRTRTGLIKKNIRSSNYSKTAKKNSNLPSRATRLISQPIPHKTVDCFNSWTANKQQAIKNDIYRSNQTSYSKDTPFSITRSTQLAPNQLSKNKLIFQRLLNIIAKDSSSSKKRKPIRQIMKTGEDELTQKYLSQTKHVKNEQKKFKKHIVDRMSKKGYTKSSIFEITQSSFDVLDITNISFVNKNNPIFPVSVKKHNYVHDFYRRSKKQTETPKATPKSMAPKEIDKSEISYMEYLSSHKRKKQFLSCHKTVKKYYAELVKNEDKILSIAKYGTKGYESLKRSLDRAVNNFG